MRLPLGPGLTLPKEERSPRGLHKTHCSHLTLKPAASSLVSSLTLNPSHYPDLPGHAAASQTRHTLLPPGAQRPHVLPGAPLPPVSPAGDELLLPGSFYDGRCVSLFYCGPSVSVLDSVYLQLSSPKKITKPNNNTRDYCPYLGNL